MQDRVGQPILAVATAMFAAIVACAVAVAMAPRAADGGARAANGNATPAATAVGSGGAAATVDRAATSAAIRVLRNGGNAVDASIVAAGVLGVTEPFSSGIGGGGFMLIRKPNGEVSTIDGRETAPAAMEARSFFENDEPLPFDPARFSGLSAGVPGTVAGWDLALRKFGTISLRKALRPGAEIARDGFRIDRTFFEQTAENADYFDDAPATAKIYLDSNGTPRNVGSTLRNPDLGLAYGRIGRLGAAGFYEGPIAAATAATAQNPPLATDADHAFRPGLMTAEDIAAYRAVPRRPVATDYRGFDVWGMGPPSSGGSTVGEALNILEGYKDLGRSRAETLHRFLEASRYSFADRNAYLADPAFFDVPLDGLLSDSFAAERRSLIKGKAADAGEVPAGTPPGANRVSPGNGTDHEGTSTTHLTVVDRNGMVVSYTFTIESTGGNALVVPGWGFLLNNELTDFNYDEPDHPNAPAGGKRPRSSMSPTIVTRGKKPVLAVGSPGGSTIITTVLQILIERIDGGRTLPQAIAAPRATQQNDSTTLAERAFIRSEAGRELARRYGHEFEVIDPPEIGAAAGVEFLPDGRLRAAAERRRRGGGSAKVVRPERRR